jgi:hypothetical protein
VNPNVGVEAAAAEVVVPNHCHVDGFARFAAALEGRIHLPEPMNLILEELLPVLVRSRHRGAREKK